jgi:hypothetical protein
LEIERSIAILVNLANPWDELHSQGKLEVSSQECVDPLVPFFGTPAFDLLSESNKKSLYDGFLVFQCEAFIALENLIMIALRKIEPKLELQSDKLKLNKMLREEYLHGRAFRDFLKVNEHLNWPHSSLFLRKSRKIKNALAFLAQKFPRAVMLPAARLEIYTVCYADYVRRQCGLDSTHPWVKLHTLHRIDELQHVETDFDVFSATGTKTHLGISFALSLQMGALTLALHAMVVTLSWHLISKSFKESSIFFKLKMLKTFLRWNAKCFWPFAVTQKRVETQMKGRLLRIPKLLSALGW